MLNKLRNLVPSSKTRDVLYTAGGMGALLLGRKLLSVGMFTKGALGLEQAWREAHPDFDGDLAARWEEAISFYEQTHADPINRKLHVIGIPMILGGTVGRLGTEHRRPRGLREECASFQRRPAVVHRGPGVGLQVRRQQTPRPGKRAADRR